LDWISRAGVRAIFGAGESADLSHGDLLSLFQARDHRGLDGDL
jgi:hypothetical protein